MKSDFLVALTQLAAERNLPREIVLSAIEAALASAYRKDSIATGQDISVKLDPGSGEVTVTILKTVVEEVEDDVIEINLADARAIKPDAVIGESIATESMPHSAGRIAAQTAKQVVMQRLREAEREIVFEEYTDKVGEVFSVTVQRVEPRQVVVDIGRGEAVMPVSEQMPIERYRQGQKFKAILSSVERTAKGTELIVSRADKDLLKRLFEMEVPEIYSGAVEIVAIAREAGSRSKVGVRAIQDGVDPIGSCVGLRGVRIQNIVNELQGEKIDVLEWNKDVGRFIANSLNPAQVMRVELDPTTQAAIAVVPDRQLSLAIGKEGQNARLAAKLTGWNVDIKSATEAEAYAEERARIQAEAAAVAAVTPAVVEVPSEVAEAPVVVDAPIEIAATAEPALAEPSVIKAPIEVPAPTGPIEAEPVLVEAVADIPVPVTPEPVEPEIIQVAAEVEPQNDLESLLDSEDELDLEALEEATRPDTEPEPAVAVVEQASIRDIPEDVWSIPQIRPAEEPGSIRFAEDIQGLRGGVTARRARRSGTQTPEDPAAPPRKRRTNSRRRRR
ncbi:MAG TPA: transcription termination/antitermination protein NusA [Dehalococcoidia bacterium]|jgi:N utilization substance protein A|nr:transcription termination/antitermination protein NusA [SAR202 cluster bacterium]HIM92109.1 transcription termination/antitermination protein NusA [Dehalococcoidia bacterium]|tara:strand:- start:1615 stop:3291 length:1677 start_codon:yes stop_codon:yes gene_type:complete